MLDGISLNSIYLMEVLLKADGSRNSSPLIKTDYGESKAGESNSGKAAIEFLAYYLVNILYNSCHFGDS